MSATAQASHVDLGLHKDTKMLHIIHIVPVASAFWLASQCLSCCYKICSGAVLTVDLQADCCKLVQSLIQQMKPGIKSMQCICTMTAASLCAHSHSIILQMSTLKLNLKTHQCSGSKSGKNPSSMMPSPACLPFTTFSSQRKPSRPFCVMSAST